MLDHVYCPCAYPEGIEVHQLSNVILVKIDDMEYVIPLHPKKKSLKEKLLGKVKKCLR